MLAAVASKKSTQCRRRLARIRCLQECVTCFRDSKPMPEALCYMADFHFQKKPGDSAAFFEKEWWGLLYGTSETPTDDAPDVENKPSIDAGPQPKAQKLPELRSWEEVVEHTHSLHYKGTKQLGHAKAMALLRDIPANWTLEHDENLTQFIASVVGTPDTELGVLRDYVQSLYVSSNQAYIENLTDGKSDTYWESDGTRGEHYIRLLMKRNTIIKRLLMNVDMSEEYSAPTRVVVCAGQNFTNMEVLKETRIEQTSGVFDIALLKEQNVFHPAIEIRIKECRNDCTDTRVHGLKIKSYQDGLLGLGIEDFGGEHLKRFPKLSSFPPEVLYKRAFLIQRFVGLLDIVLPYIIPQWPHSVGTYNFLQHVRQFLALSRKRQGLINYFLKQTELASPSMMKLFLNRHKAAEHRSNPSADPTFRNSIFSQIYEGLKVKEAGEAPYDYRWDNEFTQWWECKFTTEGVIDQGGAFRDSLSDISEELSPSADDVPLPLPFFIRSPNQVNVDANVNRDGYIPNPSCKEFQKYEWLGKLMGACFRGNESLVLAMTPFFWKKLIGEQATWSRDYVTVDRAEVLNVENMLIMDNETYQMYFGEERTWSTLLSDGAVVSLQPHGQDKAVHYEDRLEYCRLVQEKRMNESNAQIDAIRRGLLSVVPQVVLDLLSWHEVEKRICGDPVVSVDELKKSCAYEDLEESHPVAQFFWQAMTNFSNEDRSRFLRFVTGRRRLPSHFNVSAREDLIDCLPEVSTCSFKLYLPTYTSVEIAEEKLRYAAYNCIAIDTDTTPWSES